MNKTIVAQLYNDIIEYLNSNPQKTLLSQYEPYEIISDGKIVYKEDVSIEEQYDEMLLLSDIAFREYKSRNDIDTDNERIRRYLSQHFSYLMKNVLYLDMKELKAKGSRGSYWVLEDDAPIIKEILLRSVSENEKDVIIGKWLKGKLDEYDYQSIVDLSGRLFHIINCIPSVEDSKKMQWIDLFKIALKTDYAYTMTEVIYTINEIFSFSLPFNPNIEQAKNYSTHSEISTSIINEVDSKALNAQQSMLSAIYEYLKITDIERIISDPSIPYIELQKLKSVCEFLYTHNELKKIIPNNKGIDKAIKYFINVDKNYEYKLIKRKELDHQRHIRKNNQKKR